MGKGTKTRKKKHAVIDLLLVSRELHRVEQQMVQEKYTTAVMICERLLRYLPQSAPQRVEALAQLGVAQGMMQNFPQSYEAFTAAVALDPQDPQLWYNRCTASRLTLRFGQALRDIERAIEVNTRSEYAEQLSKELEINRQNAEESIKMRGPDFTVDQLIEQENLFQRGLKCIKTKKWEEGAQAFQRSIALGDCLPQPWGNLGICLLMQERYDEAEAALQQALEIDPEYKMAMDNLAALPACRHQGPPARVTVSEPFKGSALKPDIIFVEE
ncbi:MAG TPA: tetratricopeptide repeat protein [Ktedonobacteraceae bacterium]|jgi:tetratricopeptide (TPR) repeat protein